MNTSAAIAILFAGWFAYGALHSILASFRAKEWVARQWPNVMPYYRLLFNAVSLAGLVPLLYIAMTYPAPGLWQWRGAWQWVAILSAVVATLGIAWMFRYYDIAEFLGLRQARYKSISPDIGPFRLSPAHRFVRHPWYALALLMIWTRDMNMLTFVSSLMATVYFYIGSRMEENKLCALYGEVYRRYCRLVPGLLPLPWRFLKTAEVKILLESVPPEMASNTSGENQGK